MNPLNGKITSRFGKRKHPVTGMYSFHNGIDIACKIGTRIVAPDNGVISEIWDHVLGGKCIAMVSSKGTRFGFAHLSERTVVKGQTVVEGQEIARSGNTGRTTGPHLHFTVKINGNWTNPTNIFNY